jgi:hypothetical protein
MPFASSPQIGAAGRIRAARQCSVPKRETMQRAKKEAARRRGRNLRTAV